MILASVVLAATLTLPRHAIFGAVMADKPAGTTVSRVLPGSPAASAGIAAGDVVKQLAGVSTPNVAAFLAQIHQLHGGQTATILVEHNGAARTISMVLGTPVDEADPAVTTLYEAITVDGTLRRTLVTLPKNAAGPRPAVLVLGGIGCYSVDVAANPQDPYMRLTHDLSRAGFVTMRVEKSGVGDSQGPPCHTIDFYGEERMYAAAYDALRQHEGVDPKRVYLFGHSIGTTSAPRLALQRPVAGLIVAEGVGRDWPEYEIRNTRRQAELSGETPAKVDQDVLDKSVCMTRFLFLKEPEDAIEHDNPACKDANQIYPVDPPYVQQIAALDIIGTWTKINIPVLAIYGRSDFVTEEPDHRRIVDIVNAHHPHTATFHGIDGMDHYLAVAKSQKESLDLTNKLAPRTYDPAFSTVIVQWLKSVTAQKTPS